VRRHAVDLDRNPREIKRFLNVFRFYAYIAFWRRSAGLEGPDLDGAAKLATIAVRCPHLLSMLGTDGLLEELETAAEDDAKWEAVIGGTPEHARDALTGLRAVVARYPRVAGRAAGFL
jgi:hypothetical protein